MIFKNIDISRLDWILCR